MISIKFNEYGSSLGTRQMGSKMRKKICKAISDGNTIEFDFQGVSVISHSYADEVFRKSIDILGIKEFKKSTKFLNANHFVSSTILNAIKNRL